MIGTNPALLLAAVVAGWAVQMLLGYRQSRAFRRETAALQAYGQITVGTGGRRYRGGRAFVALAVDAGGHVRAATVLRGWTTFARSRPLYAVVGTRLNRLAGQTPVNGLDAPAREACRQAAELLISARRSGSVPRSPKEATTTTES